MTLPRLQLPDWAARQTLEHAVEALRQIGLEPPAYAMGGGTALSAQWGGHRQSTDNDLFTPEGVMKRIIFSIGRKEFFERLQRRGARSVEINDTGASWSMDLQPPEEASKPIKGHVSIFDDHTQTSGCISRQTDPVHGVPFERTSHILWKKLRMRMLENNRFYARDAHDLTACALEDPKALLEAMSPLKRTQTGILAGIIMEFRDRDPNWDGTSSAFRNRALLNVRHKHLTGPALWENLSDLLANGAENYIQRAQAERRQREAQARSRGGSDFGR